MSLLLQITESLQTLTKYDDSDIVKGIIICFVLMAAFMTLAGTVYVKFFRVKLNQIPPAKINLTALQAMEITTTMGQKLLDDTIIDGHSAAKRISKLHHDTATALQNSNEATTAWTELAEGQTKFMKMVGEHYKNQATRDIAHHEQKMDLQIALNKKILELAKKR